MARINLLRYTSSPDPRRKILKALIDQVCDDYDLDSSRISSWIKTKKGLEQFIKYLEEAGYRVKSYSWPPDDREPMSWGLEFDEEEPNFVALKMRYLDMERKA